MSESETTLSGLAAGGAVWWRAMEEAIGSNAQLGDYERAADLVVALDEEPADGALPDAVICCSKAVVQMLNASRRDLAEHLLTRVQTLIGQGDVGGVARAYAQRAHGNYRAGVGDLGGWVHHLGMASAEFRMSGDQEKAVESLIHEGYAYLRLGAAGRAETTLRAALDQAEASNFSPLVALAQHNLGLALGYLGRIDEAILVEQEALDAYVDHNPRMEGGCREYFARILLAGGHYEHAEREARLAVQLASPAARVAGLAVLASSLLAQDRAEEAEQIACEAVAIAAQVDGVIEEGEILARVVYARALLAVEQREDALEAAKIARSQLLAHAARIQDPQWRASFLENVEENVQAMRLYQSLFGA